MMRPIAEAWLAPFHDLGASTVTIRNTGGTDHLSFDAVGLPGFQFIQDPMDYASRTHHSNMDLYDRIQKGDLMQMAAIVASFVYKTAMREEMLPRKPLPKARPAKALQLPPPAEAARTRRFLEPSLLDRDFARIASATGTSSGRFRLYAGDSSKNTHTTRCNCDARRVLSC